VAASGQIRLAANTYATAARLAQEYGVAKGTAVKALDVLRREGLTRTVAGWGRSSPSVRAAALTHRCR
jgi:DNA-binding IclR family transcriptional regulator